MENPEVIKLLKQTITELGLRLRELQRAKLEFDGPPEDYPKHLDDALRAMADVAHERGRIQRELDLREFMASLREIPPLSQQRRDALTQALEGVGRDIARGQAFATVLTLVAGIVDSAKTVASAARLS